MFENRSTTVHDCSCLWFVTQARAWGRVVDVPVSVCVQSFFNNYAASRTFFTSHFNHRKLSYLKSVTGDVNLTYFRHMAAASSPSCKQPVQTAEDEDKVSDL